MTTNLDYCFIKAPPGLVRRAWKRWTGGVSDNAYFVPAQGGCFLVTVKEAAHVGPLAWLQAQVSSLTAARPMVEQFKADFENGLVG